MLPRPCSYQSHHVGRDKRNATALDPDFDWTAGSQETDLGNFEIRELRNWLAARLGDAVELREPLIFDFPTMRQIEAHVRAHPHVVGHGALAAHDAIVAELR